MSGRDRAILGDVARLRYVTGTQLQRLHVTGHTARGAAVVRSRILTRLTRAGLLFAFPQRIGGIRAGSGGVIYTLDTAGQHLINQRDGQPHKRVRKPWPHLPLSIHHALAVSELYVRLVDECRNRNDVTLVWFEAEPECWWPGNHGVLKPDAYLVLHTATTSLHWWVEVDRETERLPVVKRKLQAYAAFAKSGSSGPDDVVPRILIAVLTATRAEQIRDIASRLTDSELGLFTVAVVDHAAGLLVPPPNERDRA